MLLWLFIRLFFKPVFWMLTSRQIFFLRFQSQRSLNCLALSKILQISLRFSLVYLFSFCTFSLTSQIFSCYSCVLIKFSLRLFSRYRLLSSYLFSFSIRSVWCRCRACIINSAFCSAFLLFLSARCSSDSRRRILFSRMTDFISFSLIAKLLRSIRRPSSLILRLPLRVVIPELPLIMVLNSVIGLGKVCGRSGVDVDCCQLFCTLDFGWPILPQQVSSNFSTAS